MTNSYKLQEFSYLKIFFDVEELPYDHRYRNGFELLPNLSKYPALEDDTDVHDYLYRKCKIIYLAKHKELEDFFLKLQYISHHIYCKFENSKRHPFFEILFQYGNPIIIGGSIGDCLLDFTKWESEVLSVDDTVFYKVYCSFRNALIEFKKITDSNSGLMIAKIETINSVFPPDDSEFITEIIQNKTGNDKELNEILSSKINEISLQKNNEILISTIHDCYNDGDEI